MLNELEDRFAHDLACWCLRSRTSVSVWTRVHNTGDMLSARHFKGRMLSFRVKLGIRFRFVCLFSEFKYVCVEFLFEQAQQIWCVHSETAG